MTRLSARACRILAALGFWALIALAIVLRGTAGLFVAYAAFIWLAAFSLLAWKRQDEFERAAQKFSWVFGGLFGLLGLLAIAAPFARPFVVHPKASWLNALPLAFVVLAVLRLLYTINRAAGNVGANREVTSFVQDLISLGSGAYILIAAGAFLAFRAFRGR